MRKRLIAKLVKFYLRTYPPFAPNGNGKIGNIKRIILSPIIIAVAGGYDKFDKILSELTQEFKATYGD